MVSRDMMNGTGRNPIDGAAGAAGYREALMEGLPVTERRLELGGISTAVIEGGAGPPLVLLHGPGEFALTWLRVIPGLAEAHRAIAPDLPGHGASATGREPLDVDRVLAWLDALIAQTCDAPPVLAGHLMGGSIGLHYARRYPGRLEHLVLVDSFGLAPYRPSARFALTLIGFMARPTPRSRDRFFNHCFHDMERLEREAGDKWKPLMDYALHRARSADQKATLRALMPKLAMPAIAEEDLDAIEEPVSLIWGRHDKQVRLRIAEAAARRYGWTVHVVEDAADDPAVEQPAAFVGACREALAAHPVPAAP